MIRKSVGLLALVVFLFLGLSYGAPMHQRAITPKEIANDSPSYIPKGRGRVHHLGIMKWGKGEVVIDTIQYCWDIGEYNTPLDCLDYTTTYDSVWWKFRPVADGTLMAVQGCFHTSGKVHLYLCHFLRDTCDYLMEDDVWGRNPNLLIWPCPGFVSWSVTGNDSIWQTKDPIRSVVLSSDTSYVIGYCTDNTGHPYINWDDPITPMRTTREHDWRFSYGHQTVNCDRNDPDWACLCYSEDPDDTIRTAWYYILYLTDPYTHPYIMLRAIVMYVPPIPPFMQDIDQLMDTFQTEVDFPVEAKLRDLDGTVTSAKLYWWVKGNAIDSVSMEISEEKVTHWTAVGHITGSFSVGDTVEYWCYGWDNDGLKSIWNGLGSEIKRFIIRKLPPPVSILLVGDSASEKAIEFYRRILDDLGYGYYYWSVSDCHGIDSSIIEACSCNTVIIFGCGASSLPGSDYSADSLWVPFLEGGTIDQQRNILYIDQDYFCAHPDDYGCEFNGSLGPGEFLYDFFGVRAAWSDNDFRDTLFVFLDSIAGGTWVDSLLSTYPDSVNTSSWTDFTWPRIGAKPLFLTDVGSDSCGVRYETPIFKTFFLSFLLDAAVDPATKDPSEAAYVLTGNILRWFKTSVQEIHTGRELPKAFVLFQNYPNPFNPITKIKYALPRDCWVRFEIYNILGQKVATLVDGKQKAGYKVAKWDAVLFASGIYFYRLQAGNFVQTRKMVLLK